MDKKWGQCFPWGHKGKENIEKELIEAIRDNNPQKVYDILSSNWRGDLSDLMIIKAKEAFKDYEPIKNLYCGSFNNFHVSLNDSK